MSSLEDEAIIQAFATLRCCLPPQCIENTFVAYMYSIFFKYFHYLFIFSPGLDGWFWDTFNTTVRMPTYLIAVIISDFTYDEASPDIFPKPVRVRHKPIKS